MRIKKLTAAVLAVSLCFCAFGCGPRRTPSVPNEPDKPSETLNEDDDTDNTDNDIDKTDDGLGDDPDDGTPRIEFNADGGAFLSGDASVTFTADTAAEKIDKKGKPRKSGYAFIGWYNGSDRFDPEYDYTRDATFTAKYADGSTDSVYDSLFDVNSTVEFSFDMSDEQWKKLGADYNVNDKSPIYRMADWASISVTDADGTLVYWYDEVGVRLKGNTSRHNFYGNDGFYDNVHFKLKFGETFDDEEEYLPSERKEWNDSTARKARKNRTFATLEKLDLKYNSTYDETYCKDLYAMKLFRDNGIIVPQSSLCAVKAKNRDAGFINLGVYKVSEPVDEVFLARMLPNDCDGDLYKCSWGSNVGSDFTNADGTVGVEDELNRQFYTYDKKTNKKKGFTSMINFIAAVNGSSPDFGNLIDTDYFAKFEAVNYLLGNPDCIRNNANNFYTYFRKDGKAIFIPYDYDRCLGITSWDPTGNGCTELTPYTRKRAVGSSQSNPLYVNLIDKGAPTDAGSVLMRYRQNLITLSQSDGISNEAFSAFKNGYKAKYANAAKTALKTNSIEFDSSVRFDVGYNGNVPLDNISYGDYISRKLQTLNNNIDNYTA